MEAGEPVHAFFSLDSPSFRPTFSVHQVFLLLGAIACVAILLLINVADTIVAATIVIGLYVWLQRRSLRAIWGMYGKAYG